MDANSLLPVKSARASAQAGIEPVKVIGGADEKQAVIVMQTVDLVQEERAVEVRYETVKVLHNHNARRNFAGLFKDIKHASLVTAPA